LIIAATVFFGLSAVVGAQTAVGYYTRYREQAASSVPTPPSSAWQNVFVDTADHKLKRKDSTATVTTIEGGGGGGTTQTIDVINATAATAKIITSAAANSGTNTGITFNNSTTLGGTTRIVSFQNNGTDEAMLVGPGSVPNAVSDGYGWINSSGAFGIYNSGLSGLYIATSLNRILVGNVGVVDIVSGALRPVSDGGTTLGGASKRFDSAAIGAAAVSQPTCDATTRGTTMTVFADSLSADTLQICMKNAADSYSWQTVFTAL
jgi:hypothetical protein